MKKLIATALLAVLPMTANALEYGKFKTFYAANPETTGFYLSGVYAGMMITNVMAGRRTGEQIFCPPTQLAFTNDQIVNMMDRFVARKKEESGNDLSATLSVDGMMIATFIDHFSCRTQQ